MWRYGVQRAVSAAVAARHRHRTTAGDAEGHDAEEISLGPRPSARPDHFGGPDRGARTQAAQAHARQPGTSVRVHDNVPYTNNISERHLRPSVIFRKVTNGFRCDWGAETYAAFRSVVNTAKVNGASVLDTLRFVLSTKLPVEHIARVG